MFTKFRSTFKFNLELFSKSEVLMDYINSIYQISKFYLLKEVHI